MQYLKVLLLEDNPGDARLVEELLLDAPRITAAVTSVPLLDKALSCLSRTRFDVAVVDLSVPDSDGEPTVDTLLNLHPELPVVVLTGRDDDQLAARAVRSGAQEYLVKGSIDAVTMGATVRYAIQRQRILNEVRRVSFVDSLTGLYNRRALNTFGHHLLRLSDRSGQPALMLFADLNDLKGINDSEGHWAGDLALVETADVLREVFRATDLVVRLGGDEFAVLALVGESETTDDLAPRINQVLARRNDEGLRAFDLSLSLGMAVYAPGCGETIDGLVRRADSVMYRQKSDEKAE